MRQPPMRRQNHKHSTTHSDWKPRVVFRASKRKEAEEVLWTFTHRSLLQKLSSRLILPSFSKELVQQLQRLETPTNRFESPLTVGRKISGRLWQELGILYKPPRYQRVLAGVKRRWQKIERQFFDVAAALPSLAVRNRYICYLTFYGGGGSFGRENQIYVRVNPRIASDIRFSNYAVAHELIHLMTEPRAQARRLSQAARERWVESIIEYPKIRTLLETPNATKRAVADA